MRVVDHRDVQFTKAPAVLRGMRLEAAERLEADDIEARVINLYSVKPSDAERLVRAAAETAGLVTVEDHWQQARMCKLAVRGLPGSGKPDELLHQAGIDSDAIVQAAPGLVGEPAGREPACGRSKNAPADLARH